ncbi:uncharacterized protein C2845_PMPSC055705 [Panicum miliaceum]|uniref:Uncharacterized protein n=1 Tax=Panicum miliaceum TaxID=4540 RepID=A0A3L6P9I6_PANMI|nr:uncharacterized protein C2845_PMPSC055705 [Panicum miliaceum]
MDSAKQIWDTLQVNHEGTRKRKKGFKRFTPADVIGRLEEHLITVKEAKISQKRCKLHE